MENMNWLNIIILIMVGLLTLEILKHLFIKKIYKILIIVVVLVIGLLIFSYYASESNPDNQAITAGATIVDSANTLKDNFDFDDFKDEFVSEINQQKEVTKKTLSKIQND